MAKIGTKAGWWHTISELEKQDLVIYWDVLRSEDSELKKQDLVCLLDVLRSGKTDIEQSSKIPSSFTFTTTLSVATVLTSASLRLALRYLLIRKLLSSLPYCGLPFQASGSGWRHWRAAIRTVIPKRYAIQWSNVLKLHFIIQASEFFSGLYYYSNSHMAASLSDGKEWQTLSFISRTTSRVHILGSGFDIQHLHHVRPNSGWFSPCC